MTLTERNGEHSADNMPPENENTALMERMDDDSVVAMITGQAIEDYVYSFKQGKGANARQVQGLTLAGVNEAARHYGGIKVDSIEYEERPNSWLAIARATDTYTGSSRYGAYEQSKKMGNYSDPHAFTKAIHKAQRNAIKQLLPVHVVIQILAHYLDNPSSSPPPQQTAPPKQADENTAMKNVFAVWGKMEKRFAAVGVEKKLFWDWVKGLYGVSSRGDMSEKQWVEFLAQINSARVDKTSFDAMVKKIKEFEKNPVVDAEFEEV